MWLRGVLTTMVLAGGLAFAAGLAPEPEPRYGRAAELVYYRVMEKASLQNGVGEPAWQPLAGTPPLLVLNRQQEMADPPADVYSVRVVHCDYGFKDFIPRSDQVRGVRLSAAGRLAMFGRVAPPQEDEDPVALADTDTVCAPVFPPGQRIRRGQEWVAEIPPIAYGMRQLWAPNKDRAFLIQKWSDTVDVMGRRCARIDYWISDKGQAESEGETHRVAYALKGTVYFGLQIGMPVLDVWQKEMQLLGDDGRLVVRRSLQRKYMLLVGFTPMAEGTPPLPEPDFEYLPPLLPEAAGGRAGTEVAPSAEAPAGEPGHGLPPSYLPRRRSPPVDGVPELETKTEDRQEQTPQAVLPARKATVLDE